MEFCVEAVFGIKLTRFEFLGAECIASALSGVCEEEWADQFVDVGFVELPFKESALAGRKAGMKGGHVRGSGRRELRGEWADVTVLGDLAQHGVIVDAGLQKAPTKGVDKQAYDLLIRSCEGAEIERGGLERVGGCKQMADRMGDLVKVIAAIIGADKVWG
jgi:hypothetical protein